MCVLKRASRMCVCVFLFFFVFLLFFPPHFFLCERETQDKDWSVEEDRTAATKATLPLLLPSHTFLLFPAPAEGRLDNTSLLRRVSGGPMSRLAFARTSDASLCLRCSAPGFGLAATATVVAARSRPTGRGRVEITGVALEM
eukprot:Rhum_TRINITY_DN15079_c21_g1::Rhum_TRINITY_DN15079_c21_g1_i1::g.137023::m.137023